MCEYELFSDYMLDIFRKNGYTPAEVFERAKISEAEAYSILFSEGKVPVESESDIQDMIQVVGMLILDSLSKGIYDNCVYEMKTDSYTSGILITEGIPLRYIHEINSEGNIRERTLYEKRFETDEDKLFFMGKYGFIKEAFGHHSEIGIYSNLFYKENFTNKEEKNND